MSETTAALIVLPFLVVLTLALECTRIGCSRLSRLYRAPRQKIARTHLEGKVDRL